MTFISYAQNFEDVVLFRALKHVKKGFYVDVGAQQPVEHSVTKAFYDRGWSGLNLEPVEQWFELLERERPRDINVKTAVGNSSGVVTFYTIQGTGLSTADAAVAESHRVGGWHVTQSEVPVRTLDDVLQEHADSDIHFLKIDVEGFEKQVLEGADFTRYRPWIVIVEATRPLSTDLSHASWETFLLEANYEAVYFDGLNRFYVAAERSQELSPALKVPPNVFDDFIKYPDWLAHRFARERGQLAHHYAQHAKVLAGQLRAARREKAEHEKRFEHERWRLERDAVWNRDELARVQRELDIVRGSLSWRMTVPARFANRARRAATRRLRMLARAVFGLGATLTGAGTQSEPTEQSLQQPLHGRSARMFLSAYRDFRQDKKMARERAA